ncbi:hypothetical protein H2248_010230 [Termitomyces sp. 'cryptogamus']|nr:hypothetical protein H2248_010230 [Termitomyces sp. 'cryptogamus']
MSCFSSYPLVKLDAASVSFAFSEQGHYDYIIVGGGTAGCVLANRLSEDPSVKVLLLERGNARVGWATRVPLLSTNFMGDEKAAYSWPSTPLANLTGNRSLTLVTGKGLGGGSAINSMNYTRGYPQDYDLWSASGCKGWSYNEIEGYFIKSEKFVSTPQREHHGTQGDHPAVYTCCLTVDLSLPGEWFVRDMGDLQFPLGRSCAEACVSLGLPYIHDINKPQTPFNVCGKLDCTIDLHGHRNSTFHAFLPPKLVSERKSHLHICTGAAVTALDIEENADCSHIKGVSFREATGQNAKIYYARARCEVILCAGAIATPQILLLSGIGPRHKVKRPLKKELVGVGDNLQDHMATGIMYNVPAADSLHIIQKSPLRAILELFRYIVKGEGLFMAPVAQLSILVNSAQINDSGHIIPPESTDPAGLPDLEIKPIHFNITEPPIPHREGVLSIMVVLMRPNSRGTISLASEDPFEQPACDLAYLSDPADYAIMRKGIKLAKRIGEKMREHGAKNMTDLYMPDSESDDDLDAFVRNFTRTNYHYSSTCRMAPENDVLPGVVDDQLRVHGLSNLRIADCSIIPIMISAHLQASAVMIAEKCADMIKASRLTRT